MLRTISPHGKTRLASVMAVVMIAIVIGITFEVTTTSAHSHKAKDAKNDHTTGPSALDIIEANVSKNGDTFEFDLKVAGNIPKTMVGSNQWNFIIDSNPDCQLRLWCDPDDYLIGLQVNPATGEYIAFVLQLTPPPPFWTITPIPFEIIGNKVTFTVQEDLIQDPSDFLWYANTRPGGFPAPTSDLLPDLADNGTIEWSE